MGDSLTAAGVVVVVVVDWKTANVLWVALGYVTSRCSSSDDEVDGQNDSVDCVWDG